MQKPFILALIFLILFAQALRVCVHAPAAGMPQEESHQVALCLASPLSAEDGCPVHLDILLSALLNDLQEKLTLLFSIFVLPILWVIAQRVPRPRSREIVHRITPGYNLRPPLRAPPF